MIPGQQAVPLPAGPVPGPRCGWCGELATDTVVLERGRTGTHLGRQKPVMEKTAPVCAAHKASLEVRDV